MPCKLLSATLIGVYLFAVAAQPAGAVTVHHRISGHSKSHNLFVGRRGPEVLLLQRHLQELGYFPIGTPPFAHSPDEIPPNGYFGLFTRVMVQDFQRSNGISPTGYVGPRTRHLLRKHIAAAVAYSKCMPTDFKLGDVVSVRVVQTYHPERHGSRKVKYESYRTTILQKLYELKASCGGDNKLVDTIGKQITFFHSVGGCSGVMPGGDQDSIDGKQDELHKLQERYTVIELTCNPGGIPYE